MFAENHDQIIGSGWSDSIYKFYNNTCILKMLPKFNELWLFSSEN